MTIAETREICKSMFARLCTPRDLLMLAIVVLASTFSFGLGYLAGLDAARESGIAVEASASAEVPVVASKSGMKYYLPWCAAADRISDANKVWFASTALAEAAGFTPASNCTGL